MAITGDTARASRAGVAWACSAWLGVSPHTCTPGRDTAPRLHFQTAELPKGRVGPAKGCRSDCPSVRPSVQAPHHAVLPGRCLPSPLQVPAGFVWSADTSLTALHLTCH